LDQFEARLTEVRKVYYDRRRPQTRCFREYLFRIVARKQHARARMIIQRAAHLFQVRRVFAK
jgi:hypothetical protein